MVIKAGKSKLSSKQASHGMPTPEISELSLKEIDGSSEGETDILEGCEHVRVQGVPLFLVP